MREFVNNLFEYIYITTLMFLPPIFSQFELHHSFIAVRQGVIVWPIVFQ